MHKTLVIIRHSKAEEQQINQSDFDRVLTEGGIQDAHFACHFLREEGLQADRIYASPSQRTKMTAEIIANEINYATENIIFEPSIYEADVSALLEVVNQIPDDVNIAFLVGHNPGLCKLADYLTLSNVFSLPTSGIVYITFQFESWRLVSKGLGSLIWIKTLKDN